MKERAYFEDRDRRTIKKWATMNKSDTGLILKKLNEERRSLDLPTFKIKALIEELRRGGGDDRTGEGYNPETAKKAYRLGKNKHLPFFDVRSINVLRYFIQHCKMDNKTAYEQYQLLVRRGRVGIIKLHSLFDVEWLNRHGYIGYNDTMLFNRINLIGVTLRGRVPPSEMKLATIEEYLIKNPSEGRYALYGDIPLGYQAVDEVTQEPLPPEQVTADVARQLPNEEEVVKPILAEPKKIEVTEIHESDDVTTITIPAGGRIRIVNTSPTTEYQLTRKGNEFIILI